MNNSSIELNCCKDETSSEREPNYTQFDEQGNVNLVHLDAVLDVANVQLLVEVGVAPITMIWSYNNCH